MSLFDPPNLLIKGTVGERALDVVSASIES